ncbi:hypothetical protein QL093DRAFT_2134852 [Fusarium oxysporum]|nr:hypothetical protein QL093DRAFT_2134852 [Fusarium oxysporum]
MDYLIALYSFMFQIHSCLWRLLISPCWAYCLFECKRMRHMIVFTLSLCEIDARVGIPSVVSQWTLSKSSSFARKPCVSAAPPG